MRCLHFIINPAAGRGGAAQFEPWLSARLRAWANGTRSVLSLTSRPGEASTLAGQAAAEADAVIAVGGDGTINEVVNGLRDNPKPLGIIPVGSGNDFIKVLGIPPDPAGALEIIRRGETRRVDLGEANGRLYANSLGLGLDAAVGRTMNRTRWLGGRLAYHWGVVVNVLFYRNRAIRWETESHSGSQRSVLAAVMNGTTYGGGYRIAPTARPDDGLLDVVLVRDLGILGRIINLPKLKKARHLGHPKITHFRAGAVRLRSEHSIHCLLDGEIAWSEERGTDLQIRVAPGALEVFAPAGSGDVKTPEPL